MFEMTYNEAMTIQRAQLAYYRQGIGRSGYKAIRKATICPEHINPNEPISIFMINRWVPRGGDIERLVKRWSPDDPTNYDMHNAIRRGIL